MKIKTRISNADGSSKIETSGALEEVMINEDIIHSGEESVALCFRGDKSSGIVELSTSEVEMLYDMIQKRAHVIKGLGRMSGGGARIIE